MKYITTFILLVTLSFVKASVKESDGGCYHRETNHAFKVGTTYNPIGECLTYTCKGEGHYVGVSCPSFVPAPGCRIGTEDLTKPFPDCCEPQVC